MRSEACPPEPMPSVAPLQPPPERRLWGQAGPSGRTSRGHPGSTGSLAAASSPASLAALTPAPGGGTKLSLSCGSAPRPAWRPHAGVRWLVAVMPSSPAASWSELGPRGHSCRSHSTTRVLGAEPASCLAEGLRERRLPARGAEARTCTCLGRHSPHTAGQSAPCSGQQVLGSGGQQVGAGPAEQSPAPAWRHSSRSHSMSRAACLPRGWSGLARGLTGSRNRPGASRGCSALLRPRPRSFWTPSWGPQPSGPCLGAAGALGEGWRGPPERGEDPRSHQPHQVRGQTLRAQLH